jgi:hypothetical protein
MRILNLGVVPLFQGWARYVEEKIWHESQTICKLPDKSLEMTLQVAGLDEIKQWVMGLGPEAEVLEPKQLKDLIQQDLKKTLSKYEKGASKTQPVVSEHKVYYRDTRLGRRF